MNLAVARTVVEDNKLDACWPGTLEWPTTPPSTNLNSANWRLLLDSSGFDHIGTDHENTLSLGRQPCWEDVPADATRIMRSWCPYSEDSSQVWMHLSTRRARKKGILWALTSGKLLIVFPCQPAGSHSWSADDDPDRCSYRTSTVWNDAFTSQLFTFSLWPPMIHNSGGQNVSFSFVLV